MLPCSLVLLLVGSVSLAMGVAAGTIPFLRRGGVGAPVIERRWEINNTYDYVRLFLSCTLELLYLLTSSVTDHSRRRNCGFVLLLIRHHEFLRVHERDTKRDFPVCGRMTDFYSWCINRTSSC